MGTDDVNSTADTPSRETRTWEYFTDEGRKPEARSTNKEIQRAVRIMTDVYRYAAEHRLTVYHVCDSLREEFRDKAFRRLANRSFADCVRETLVYGGDVKIFLNAPMETEGLLSPEVKHLLESLRSGRVVPARDSRLGDLEIRMGAWTDFRPPHFLLATNHKDRWFMRVELPHAQLDIDAPVDDNINSIPAAIYKNVPEAIEYGRQLFAMFEQWFQSEQPVT